MPDHPARPSDLDYMRAALVLAARGLGRVAPNPAVGCLIVKDGHVVGRGWTQSGGRPHAETEALARAGEAARGATVYVSLEPCAHHGATPPCADALIAAGVARVVIACLDPDPRTAGEGRDKLVDAGIEVDTGLLAGEARALNAGFLLKVLRKRPLITAKIAASLDGRIATPAGHSQWITGEAARRHGHQERALHDAILIGAGTLRADNPRLDCRLPGLEGRPGRVVVLLGREKPPKDCTLLREGNRQVLFLGNPKAVEGVALGEAQHMMAPLDADGLADPAGVAALLGGLGVTRLLIEGGAGVITSFLRAGLVDRLLCYRASRVIGGDGKAAIGPLGLDRLEAAPLFRGVGHRGLGADSLSVYIRPEMEEEIAGPCSPE